MKRADRELTAIARAPFIAFHGLELFCDVQIYSYRALLRRLALMNTDKIYLRFGDMHRGLKQAVVASGNTTSDLVNFDSEVRVRENSDRQPVAECVACRARLYTDGPHL